MGPTIGLCLDGIGYCLSRVASPIRPTCRRTALPHEGSSGQYRLDPSETNDLCSEHGILAHVLLHHPFLLRRPLQAKNITPTASFLAQSFNTCRLPATRLSQLLHDASEAGCMISTSSSGYCASVAGSVHALNSHSFHSHIVQESQQQLEHCHAFLGTLANHWHNCARIVSLHNS